MIAILINNAKVMEIKFILCTTLGEPIHAHNLKLNHLKGPLGRELLFREHGHLQIEANPMHIVMTIVHFLEEKLGTWKNRKSM